MNTINPIEEVSLDGFQIVASDMFVHLPRKSDATCSIWPSKLSFSKLVLSALNNCEYVRIEVNPQTKCLIVMPVSSSDKNSIRWIKGTKEPCVRNMESRRFGDQIYKSWGLDSDYNYRAVGRLVTANQKVMMLFDFNKAEQWKSKKDGK